LLAKNPEAPDSKTSFDSIARNARAILFARLLVFGIYVVVFSSPQQQPAGIRPTGVGLT
jgi:hypothetical protein